MTLRLSRSIGERALPKERPEQALDRDWRPVISELERKANSHVTLVSVAAPGVALEPALGRIVLVEVDTAAADWSTGVVSLPLIHVLGDEFVVFDVGGNALLEPITVTSSDGILGLGTIADAFGSLRLISDGTRWVSVPGVSVGISPAGPGMEVFNLTGASNSLLSEHVGHYVRVTHGSATSLTIASGVVPEKRQVTVVQAGAGQVTLVASGVTINTAETLRLRKQFSAAVLTCVAANVFDISGDMELA